MLFLPSAWGFTTDEVKLSEMQSAEPVYTVVFVLADCWFHFLIVFRAQLNYYQHVHTVLLLTTAKGVQLS